MCYHTLIGESARKGANIVLLQELFAGPYFPIEQRDYFAYAINIEEDKSYLHRFQCLARELNVVLPLSFYERSNNAHFNSVLVIDADGSQLGIYRKSHIPDGPGYQEKYYFSPGNTGFKVWHTRFGSIGIGICWDQWFPEAARIMVIEGAEILLFPTAIGSEPHAPALDSCGHWQRCMQGHSAANMIPIVASNRIGKETGKENDVTLTFYGSSFMTDHTGAIVADAGRHLETILVHTYNLTDIKLTRFQWGVFRDRRPELYGKLHTFDGIDVGVERRAPFQPTQQPQTQQQQQQQQPPAPPQQQQQQQPNGQLFRGIPTTNIATVTPATVNMSAGIATAMANSTGMVPTKSDSALIAAGMMQIEGDTNGRASGGGAGAPANRGVVAGNFDLHEASFIGEVKLSAQRRPRGRCWVCRNKTTYECKVCVPGPVPLCNRTSRECWWKYHAGEIGPYVPNKRGRKRRKAPEATEVPQVPAVQQNLPQVPQSLPQVQQSMPQVAQTMSQVQQNIPQVQQQVPPQQGLTQVQQVPPQHPHHHHDNENGMQGNTIQTAELNQDDVDGVKVTTQTVAATLPGDNGVGELLQ